MPGRKTPVQSAVKQVPLSHESVTRTALALIDESGLEAFSMRRLGAALGVEGMAVYYYFKSKEELLDAVSALLLDELDMPARLEADWLAWLRHAAHSYRAIAKRHPNAFPLLAVRRYTTAAGFERLQTFFRVMREAGFDAAMTARVFRTIGYFINGAGLADIATLAAETDPTRSTPLDDFPDAVRFPDVAAVAPYLRLEQLDGIFDFGLELLLAGLRDAPKTHPGPSRRARPASPRR